MMLLRKAILALTFWDVVFKMSYKCHTTPGWRNLRKNKKYSNNKVRLSKIN